MDDQAGSKAVEKEEVPNALVTVHFRNALDKTLRLANVTLILDGEPLGPVTNLAPQGDNVVYTGRMKPGPHTLTTRVTCIGRKRGGVFTYLKDYKWDVSSEHTLNVLPNRSMVFTVSTVRRKGMNVPATQMVKISVYNELLPETTSLRD